MDALPEARNWKFQDGKPKQIKAIFDLVAEEMRKKRWRTENKKRYSNWWKHLMEYTRDDALEPRFDPARAQKLRETRPFYKRRNYRPKKR